MMHLEQFQVVKASDQQPTEHVIALSFPFEPSLCDSVNDSTSNYHTKPSLSSVRPNLEALRS